MAAHPQRVTGAFAGRERRAAAAIGVLVTAAAVSLVVVGFGSGSDAATPTKQLAQNTQQFVPYNHPLFDTTSSHKTSVKTGSAPVKTSPAHTSGPTSGSKRTATKAGNTKKTTTTKKAAEQKSTKPVVYTVKPGDNLTAIAQWYKVRGYAPLYAWNKTVIGRNPNLIFPGQKITVVPGGAVSTASHGSSSSH